MLKIGSYRSVFFVSVFYGVTDAENGQGDFFGQERLWETACVHRERAARDVQDALLAEVHRFVGDAPQFDDITLMVVRKSAQQ